ncbi:MULTISPECIES: Pr6Pr family membrane protein [unclassified Mesorhizobium]|uniref:Pr6Pr family membrane protein n=2 Tax=Mesorhizobium TaxID=68287 RepID=UPI0019D009F1|nr:MULTISPECIES: Pr6Pr family membrane protein [unclassified Mesorhizobium]
MGGDLICRLLALIICLSACTGIGLELSTLMNGGASIFGSLWVLIGYFTILTNGLVAVVFGAAAFLGERFDHPRLVAGVAAVMALVGVIFALLLQGLRTLAGATAEANFLLHQLNPVLVVLFWLLFTRKGTLSWRDPLLWALYPLVYLAYALARGAAEGKYAYPFIDVSANGWVGAMSNAVVIALGFVAAAEALVLVDRVLARR